jgi:hypothetical protein
MKEEAQGGSAKQITLRIVPIHQHAQPSSLQVNNNNDSMLLTVEDAGTTTIFGLKVRVRTLLKVESSRYVRLICHGKLLAPDSATLASLNLKQSSNVKDNNTTTKGDNDEATSLMPRDHDDGAVIVVHAVVAAPGQQGGAQALLQSPVTSLTSLPTTTNHRRAHPQRRRRPRHPQPPRGLGAGEGRRNSRLFHTTNNNTVEDDESSSNSSSSGSDGSLIDRMELGLPASSSPAVGFRRLRYAPYYLRREQIQVIRAMFSSQVDAWLLTQAPSMMDDTTDLMQRRYRQEEAWMMAQGPASEFRLNLGPGIGPTPESSVNDGTATSTTAADTMVWRIHAARTNWAAAAAATTNAPSRTTSTTSPTQVGTDRDFLWGFMLGFFMGFIMLVWVWMPSVPHKQKLGILTGLSVQLTFTSMGHGNRLISDPTLLGEALDDILGES